MEDKEIVLKILDGDHRAFQILVEKYQEMVFRTCMGLLHNPDDADDIAQEVFVEVYESLGYFRHEAKLSTWIYRIAVNKSLNYLKKTKRKSLFKSLEEIFQPGQKNELSVSLVEAADKDVEAEEQKRMLETALNKLPENQRIAFVLFRYDELPQKEIAEIMGLSVSAVESLVHRARKNLYKLLENTEIHVK